MNSTGINYYYAQSTTVLHVLQYVPFIPYPHPIEIPVLSFSEYYLPQSITMLYKASIVFSFRLYILLLEYPMLSCLLDVIRD